MSVLRTRKARGIAVVTGVAVVAIGGGMAFAYWTSTGVGTGNAVTGSSSNFTVTSVAAVGDPLTPGGTTQSVGFTVANPGSGSQSLSNVVVTVANADGSDWVAVPGCSAADFTIGVPAVVFGEIAGGANVPGTVTVAMNNLPSDQDACKGVTAPLYFVAS